MPFRFGRPRIPWCPFGLVMSLGLTLTASAQPPPDQSPFSQPPAAPAPPTTPAPAPPTPSPTTPPNTVSPSVNAAAAADPSKEALEERVRQLEAMVQQLAGQVQTMSSQPGQAAGAGGPAGPDVPSPGNVNAPSRSGGFGAPGQSLPPNPPPSARFNQPATLDNKKANAKFGPGFEIRSDDDEFIFQFHDLTQLDYRGYQQGGQTNVRDSFLFPRQWFMFSGRAGKPFGYFVSLANGFDTLSILDVFLDIEYDPRIKFRLGRFKTPFTYEFLVEPVQGLTVPERSIFFNNFGQNRDLGVMAYGRLFKNTFDYAGGIFNGTRNSFVDAQNSKKVSWFINYRPFGNHEGSVFENFNIGGSVYAGESQQVPVPQTLRTVVPTTGNAAAGVPFMGFNSNVRESGFQAFWDLHVAYFYKQLAFIGEWGSGTEDYALAGALQNRFRIPIQSFYLQTSYLLTGETRSSIGIVKPISPFDLRKGHFGTGAIEPYFRYEFLDVGSQVYNDGLVDKNLWANRVFQTWTGVNWHLTQYVKVYFGWNHAEFNQPVIFAPGRRQLTSDMFLLRLQLYF
jgi:phosphate-selective porin OprO and OprP